MNWSLIFLPDAQKDLKSLSGDQRILVAKALDKVRKNMICNFSFKGRLSRSFYSSHVL